MLLFIYEVLGGIIFMFYLHLLGFGKENFSSISKKIKYNSQKYKLRLLILFLLILILIFIEQTKVYNKM